MDKDKILWHAGTYLCVGGPAYHRRARLAADPSHSVCEVSITHAGTPARDVVQIYVPVRKPGVCCQPSQQLQDG